MPTFDLAPYQKDEALGTLHWEFGNMLARRGHVAEEDKEAVSLLGAKCLQAVDNGHSCLSLKDWPVLSPEEIPERISDYSPLELDNWHSLFERTSTIVSENEKAFTPLFFDKKNELLYLRKYYDAEKRIAEFVLKRLDEKTNVILDDNLKREIGESSRLFTKSFKKDMQQQAIAMALTHKFSILTGGPGTGKTTTLAAFLVHALKKNPSLNIALAAPTGKAAVRMKDSLSIELSEHLQNVPDDIRKRIEKLSSSTLHRLLGMSGEGIKPRYNQEEQLPYNLIVIDEVSMVSLRLLDMLFNAIDPDCQVLLIGDHNQLASVEAGSVLADFCNGNCKKLNPIEGQAADKAFITRLLENHRAENPKLKEFLVEMNTPQKRPLSEVLASRINALYEAGAAVETVPEFAARELPATKDDVLKSSLETCINAMLKNITLPNDFKDYFGEVLMAPDKFSLDHWRSLQSDDSSDEESKSFQLPLALSWLYLDSFRILCTIHKGTFGDRLMNQLMAKILEKKKGDDGIPVIIGQNDQRTGLVNGDVGMFWKHKVYFPEWKKTDKGSIFDIKRSFIPSELPEYSLAYAITIHKSQGSGYDNVLMILPKKDSRIVTKELIYTGISRTKKRFLLWGAKEILTKGIDRPTVRWSGLPRRFE